MSQQKYCLLYTTNLAILYSQWLPSLNICKTLKLIRDRLCMQEIHLFLKHHGTKEWLCTAWTNASATKNFQFLLLAASIVMIASSISTSRALEFPKKLAKLPRAAPCSSLNSPHMLQDWVAPSWTIQHLFILRNIRLSQSLVYLIKDILNSILHQSWKFESNSKLNKKTKKSI